MLLKYFQLSKVEQLSLWEKAYLSKYLINQLQLHLLLIKSDFKTP